MANNKKMIKLLAARKAAGITQEELGKRVGVDACTISAYERGQNFPRWGTLEKLAAALGCEARDLI